MTVRISRDLSAAVAKHAQATERSLEYFIRRYPPGKKANPYISNSKDAREYRRLRQEDSATLTLVGQIFVQDYTKEKNSKKGRKNAN